MEEAINWCIECHSKTNHFYDKYLPYEFHLRMVVQAYNEWKHLLPDSMKDYLHLACWAHDLIEDTRTSYNDVNNELGIEIADIVFAVTNDKGKNRKERAGDKYYEGIRNTPYADFVKLCDRIANVQYSKLTKSKMFDLYQRENENFINKIGNRYPLMNEYLKIILSSKF